MGIASLVIGIAAAVLFIITLIPLLGLLNVIVLPLAGLGFLLGLIGLGIGFSRTAAIWGTILNLLVIIFGFMRLF